MCTKVVFTKLAATHTEPSEAVVMLNCDSGRISDGSGKSLSTCVRGRIHPMRGGLSSYSSNQIRPSGVWVMCLPPKVCVGYANSVIVPVRDMLAMWVNSSYQTLPLSPGMNTFDAGASCVGLYALNCAYV